MTSHAFSYAFQPLPDFARYIRVGDLTFPSAITSESERNNTVHCEYYQPKGEGPFPGVIVLHILGGDFALSRLFANTLSQHGVAALFLKMPYYGPRRGSDGRRMISVRPDETVEGMTQAVLDIRRATAWLGARPEVDETELGLFGISLGGITGALAATAEPRLKNLCLLLAGGDIGEVTWTARETRKLREQWTAAGGTKEQLVEILKAVDPVTYADRLPLADRRILMLNATDDEVVPKRCTLSLWESFGRPPIEWYAGGHYTVARHLLAILMRVPAFFVAQKAFPGKVSEWNGYPRYDFEVDGKMVTVVAPKQAAPGRPWVWHGEFFGHKPDPDIALLGKGFHIVYMRVPDMLGAPRAVAHWNRLYDVLTKQHGLAKRAALVGLSRGGLYCYNWAAANPDKVACIYGDAPVCDFKSWPGGRGAGKGSQRDWALVLKVYEFKSEEQALAYDKNPVDNLAPLAKAGVPLLHVFGDADEVVPWEENTKLIADRYRALGGDIQLIRKPGIGHHPHGLKDSTPIVDFILRHAMGQQEK
ncbi:MAG: prolyl oligopeptidase family serine peptidase [Planctomycetales bacterium]|nr:prolyl oligopeptidase family serine peptidase [Planctomycetales bacterium]